MAIRIANFSGEIPRLIPRLLPESNAQIARHVHLDDGALTPIGAAVQVATVPAGTQTIYRHNGSWLSWSTRVNCVPGPVAADRLYITGDGAPKVRAPDGTVYPLALPAPVGALTAAVIGSVSGQNFSTILYTYTYVTVLDEESPPAPVSNELLWESGVDVTLTGFAIPPAGRGIDRIRVYRSQTSELGATEFYFIAEIDELTAAWVDDVDGNPIQEAIPSRNYDPPPADMRGLIALPNGMMAAFSGRVLCFCEPWIPHAWPEMYRLTMDADIVGLGAFGSSIAVMTRAQPYVVQGTAPENMTSERLETILPCLSAEGIVDLGYAVAYPSTDGLVTVSSAGAVLATQALLTPRQWAALAPASFVGGYSRGRYVASWTSGGARSIVILDLTGGAFVARADDAAVAMHNDPASGSLYTLVGTSVREWSPDSASARTMMWRTKRFEMPSPVNYGAIQIDGGAGAMSARIIADDVLMVTVTEVNRPVRLPSGRLASSWEIEIEGTRQITAIQLVEAISELGGAR